MAYFKDKMCLIFLLLSSGAFPESGAIRVVDCSENKYENVHAGGFIDGVRIKPLDVFTVCLRFQFLKLQQSNVITALNVKDEARPLFQFEVFVYKLRFVVAKEYKITFLENWTQPDHWYHVCVVHRPSSSTSDFLYLDGKLISEHGQKLQFTETLISNRLWLCLRVPKFRPDIKFVGNVSDINIWQRSLRYEEILKMAKCESSLHGDVLDWENTVWDLQNVSYYDVELKDFCNEQNEKDLYVLGKMQFEEAAYVCEGLGGSMYVPLSYGEIQKFYEHDVIKQSVKSCKEYWVGVWETEENNWVYHANGQPLQDFPWGIDEPNGMRFENCGDISPQGVGDSSCDRKGCAVCDLPVVQQWKLYGSCEKFAFNTKFTRKHNGTEIIFRGYGSYIIRKEKNRWIWVDESKISSLIAVLDSNKYNYPHGRHHWKLKTSLCSQKQGRRLLLLTSCSHNQFTCDSGICIPRNSRCDFKYDCSDNSDESDCQIVNFPFDYKNTVVPRGRGADKDPVDIFSQLILETIMVDTNNMILNAAFNLSMRWCEKRVTYSNLKWDQQLNFVGKSASLWTPTVYFVNTLEHAVSTDDHLTSTFVMRVNESKPIKSEGKPEVVELFHGDKNPLESYRKYRISFTCDFDLTRYPFDSQVCFMKLLLKSGTEDVIFFSPNCSVRYAGSSLLMEYKVGKLSLETYSDGGYSGIKVIIPLTRRHGYAFINIYLPSLTMLIIGYLTMFFKSEIFEIRIMTALTALLVMATLFTQVAASLPKTSYFKMVDVWLLFCIFYTFFVIVYHILIDSFIPSAKQKQIPHNLMFLGSADKGGNLTSFAIPTKNSDQIQTRKLMFKEIKSYFKDSATAEKVGRAFMTLVFVIFNTVYWGTIYCGM